MNRLWAPWRKAYIRPDKKSDSACLFCRVLREKKDVRNLVLKRASSCFAILNLYPYNNGHVMVVPSRHVRSFSQLSDREKVDWLNLSDEVLQVLQNTMKAQGFNVGMNLGKTAGAGIPGHLHLHIVPRWEGDHNFMPVLGDCKVVSESLKSAYETLRSGLKIRARRKG